MAAEEMNIALGNNANIPPPPVPAEQPEPDDRRGLSRSPRPYRFRGVRSQGRSGLEELRPNNSVRYWTPWWTYRTNTHPRLAECHVTHLMAQHRAVLVCTKCMEWTKESKNCRLIAECADTPLHCLPKGKKAALKRMNDDLFPYAGGDWGWCDRRFVSSMTLQCRLLTSLGQVA